MTPWITKPVPFNIGQGAAAAAGGGFTPNDISDLWAWWKAESEYMTLDGDAVESWNPETDETTRQVIADNADLEPTFEAAGRNGRGIVKFDGSESMHTEVGTLELTNPFTFAMAMKFPAAGEWHTIFDVDNTGGGRVLCRSTATSGKYGIWNGSPEYSATVTGVDDAWGYMVIVLDGGDSVWRINGGNEAALNNSHNFRPITFSSDYQPANFAAQDIMHFIIYDKAVEGDELESLESWLADEVGL